VHDDRTLFELLTLEGAQAGLSWETVLKKRAGYKTLFRDFDPVRVARMTDKALEKALTDTRIVRHRQKVFSTRKNARVFLDIQKEFGSFSDYLWGFVNHAPIINHWQRFADVPVSTAESDALSKDLKKRGIGVLITDHNVRETLEIVDRAYILHDGKVLMSGTPQEVVQNENVRRVYLGDNFRIS
jgi:DNA-3-methyladenine glycosylase I